MKRALLLFMCCLSSIALMCQELERLEVEGRIIVKNNDIEGVTVYNTSSNKGTITDEAGKFKINAGLNDIIEVSALQFEKFTITINETILKSRKLTVYLVERINKLDEVVILPYGLSGNLVVDLEKVKTFNPDLDAIYFGIGDVSAYEFSADQYTKVENMFIDRGQFRYGTDVLAVFDLLLKPLFKQNNTKAKNNDRSQEDSNKNLTDEYGNEFISNNFNIPEDRVEAFIVFVENNGLDPKLLNKGNEMILIEFLVEQSKLFLKL